MRFNIGDIVFIKTTNEAVTVLAENTDSSIEVRRATMTKDNGVVHNVESFNAFELETEQENVDRLTNQQLADYKRQKALFEMTRSEAKPALIQASDIPMAN